MADGLQALTEREKEALRLLVRGHDAKSLARQLGLSVHTINERLRDARRKLEVSTSREAGRLLLAQEGNDPQLLGSRQLGDASDGARGEDRRNQAGAVLAWVIGVFAMSLVVATILLASSPQPGTLRQAAALAPQPETDRSALAASPEVAAALTWLALVDSQQWDASFAATGDSFRTRNTSAIWAKVSEVGRVPLGKVIARTPTSEETVHAPPAGYQLVEFETRFANRASARESVTLAREDGQWKVVGYWID